MPLPLALAVVALLVAAAWGWLRPMGTSSPGPTHLDLEIEGGRLTGGALQYDESRLAELEENMSSRPSRTAFAMSPDGRSIVYAAIEGEDIRLYLRRFEDATAVALDGTEGASQPFFSPDGSWVGFVAAGERELKLIPVAGGPSRRIVKEDRLASPSWTQEDVIVYASMGSRTETSLNGDDSRRFQISRVDAAGSTPPERLTGLSADDASHLFPQLLPGGEAVLYTVLKGDRFSDREGSQIVAQSLSGEPTALVENAIAARYLPTGHLVFARQGALMAVAFDARKLKVRGEAVELIPSVMQSLKGGNPEVNWGYAQYAVSDTGTIAYADGGRYPGAQSRVLWVDPEGQGDAREVPIAVPFPTTVQRRVSPDGTRIALLRSWGGELMVLDDSGRRIPVIPSGVGSMAWSPDGTQLAVALAKPGAGAETYHLYVVDADGASAPERVAPSDTVSYTIHDWSVDNVLLFGNIGTARVGNLWTLDLDEGESRKPFGDHSARFEHVAAFSPDGRWIAYSSNASGRESQPGPETVYVRRYPDTGEHTPVAEGAGVVWSQDQRSLFFLDVSASRMWRVGVSTERGVFERTSEPEVLFEGSFQPIFGSRDWDRRASDGRFLIGELWERPDQPVTSIHVVLDWFQELERLVPVDG